MFMKEIQICFHTLCTIVFQLRDNISVSVKPHNVHIVVGVMTKSTRCMIECAAVQSLTAQRNDSTVLSWHACVIVSTLSDINTVISGDYC